MKDTKKSLRLLLSFLESSSQYVLLTLRLLLGLIFRFGLSVHIGHLTRSFKSVYSVILLLSLLGNNGKWRTSVIDTVSFLIFNHHIFVFHCKHFSLCYIDCFLSCFFFLDFGFRFCVQLSDCLFLGLFLVKSLLHKGLLLSGFFLFQLFLSLCVSNLLGEWKHVWERSVIFLKVF